MQLCALKQQSQFWEFKWKLSKAKRAIKFRDVYFSIVYNTQIKNKHQQ